MNIRRLSLLNQPITPSRRRFFQAVAAALALVVTIFLVDTVAGFQGRPDRDEDWVGTWSASPEPAAPGFPEFNNQTLRLIAHTTVGGDGVRVRITNTHGTQNLRVGGAHIALRAAGAAIVPETDRRLTFGGSPSTIIPRGALVVSDPVRLLVPSQSDLAVSIYLPDRVSPVTGHSPAFQTSYRTPPGGGDVTSNRDGTPFILTTNAWGFLSGVEVQNPKVTDAIVAFGNGATAGCCGTVDANNRYPDYLFRRLAAQPPHGREIAVLNQGIIGNRLLHDYAVTPQFGPNALERFDRDVLAQTGVTHVILHIGIDDIGQPTGTGGRPQEEVTAEQIIAGYKQLITRARAKGLKIYGGTLTPFEGTIYAGFYTPEGEAKRQAVNQWIRNSGAFDAIFDFDAALRDPNHPTRLLPAYDRGDHLYLSDAGHEAMVNAIDLKVFK
jgi:lysophospholipase L1-like esterase